MSYNELMTAKDGSRVRRPQFVGPYHPIFSPDRRPGQDAYWMTPAVRPRCPKCKMRIRGANHVEGSYHKAGAK